MNTNRSAVEPRSACISDNGRNARLVSPLNTNHAFNTTYREVLHMHTNRSAVEPRSASISDNGRNARLVSSLNTDNLFDTIYREILHMNTKQECGGASICEHKRQRSQCKASVTSQYKPCIQYNIHVLHMNTNRSAVEARFACTVVDATTAGSVAARAAAHTKMIVDGVKSAISWFSRIIDR